MLLLFRRAARQLEKNPQHGCGGHTALCFYFGGPSSLVALKLRLAQGEFATPLGC